MLLYSHNVLFYSSRYIVIKHRRLFIFFVVCFSTAVDASPYSFCRDILIRHKVVTSFVVGLGIGAWGMRWYFKSNFRDMEARVVQAVGELQHVQLRGNDFVNLNQKYNNLKQEIHKIVTDSRNWFRVFNENRKLREQNNNLQAQCSELQDGNQNLLRKNGCLRERLAQYEINSECEASKFYMRLLN